MIVSKVRFEMIANVTQIVTEYIRQVLTDSDKLNLIVTISGDENKAHVILSGQDDMSMAKRLSRYIRQDFRNELYADLDDFNSKNFTVVRRRVAK